MKSSIKIAFPLMGDYEIPARFFLSHIFPYEIIDIPSITTQTVELGCKYSPDFVCMPFKYTLGTFIESLDKGANVLIQAGGGCKYGYYSELQREILKDLGYQFTYINLVSEGKADVKKIIQQLENTLGNFSKTKALYYLFITSKMIQYMDHIDHYIRSHIGFEEKKGSFHQLKKKMLQDFLKVNSYLSLKRSYHQYKKRFKKIKINKPKNCFKIGIIGELYTVMEPFANYELEYELANFGIEIRRYTNAHYLLFEKKRKVKHYLRKMKKYAHYRMGADALDNIARTKELCDQKYDGIIHIKSTFCTPEIGAMPVIQKICKEENMPLLFFSFDANTSEVGFKTRLEAFYDMIVMRRKL